MADVPPGEPPERCPSPAWPVAEAGAEATTEASAERCPATFDGSADKQCCLRSGHAGLHRWRSADRAQTFAWG